MKSRIGVVLDSFGEPVKDALQSASRLGFGQVELPTTSGPVAPSELSRSGRRELLHYVGGLGLQLSALGGDLGGGRFVESSAVEQRLEKTRAIVEMAAELRVPIVTTHLGRLDEAAMKAGYVTEAVRRLAEIADRTGTLIAFETGAAEPQSILDILHGVNCRSLGVCYDPASLLIDGYEPIRGIETLADHIMIARARDAMAGSPNRPGRETPLGGGQIDLAEYLATLDQAGYRSAPYIRRTESDQPQADLAEAKRRLEALVR